MSAHHGPHVFVDAATNGICSLCLAPTSAGVVCTLPGCGERWCERCLGVHADARAQKHLAEGGRVAAQAVDPWHFQRLIGEGITREARLRDQLRERGAQVIEAWGEVAELREQLRCAEEVIAEGNRDDERNARTIARLRDVIRAHAGEMHVPTCAVCHHYVGVCDHDDAKPEDEGVPVRRVS